MKASTLQIRAEEEFIESFRLIAIENDSTVSKLAYKIINDYIKTNMTPELEILLLSSISKSPIDHFVCVMTNPIYEKHKLEGYDEIWKMIHVTPVFYKNGELDIKAIESVWDHLLAFAKTGKFNHAALENLVTRYVEDEEKKVVFKKLWAEIWS